MKLKINAVNDVIKNIARGKKPSRHMRRRGFH